MVETCRCDSELMDKCHLLEINLCEKFSVFIFPKRTIKLISVILFVLKLTVHHLCVESIYDSSRVQSLTELIKRKFYIVGKKRKHVE